jgi:hypothetical protein
VTLRDQDSAEISRKNIHHLALGTSCASCKILVELASYERLKTHFLEIPRWADWRMEAEVENLEARWRSRLEKENAKPRAQDRVDQESVPEHDLVAYS